VKVRSVALLAEMETEFLMPQAPKETPRWSSLPSLASREALQLVTWIVRPYSLHLLLVLLHQLAAEVTNSNA
jgi:hypothetical protein